MVRHTAVGGWEHDKPFFRRFTEAGHMAPRRRRKTFVFENLEQRLALSSTPIQTNVQSALEAGLMDLATWADALDNHGAFAQTLPLNSDNSPLGEPDPTVGNTLDMGGLLRSKLAQPVQAYFQSDADPTTGELVQALEGLSEITNVSSAATAEVITFTLDFDANRTISDWVVEIGPDGTALGLSLETLDSKVDLDVALDLTLTFGVELAPQGGGGLSFFIQNVSLVATAEVDEDTLDYDGRLGFLEIDVQDATLVMQGQIELTSLVNPDDDAAGRVNSQEFLDTPMSDLVVLTSNGTLNGSLPVLAELGRFSTDSDPGPDVDLPVYTLQDIDIFDGVAPTLSASADPILNELANFNGVTSEIILTGINDLGTWLGFLQSSSAIRVPVPFAAGSSFDETLTGTNRVESIYRAKLTSQLVDALGTAAFDSAQSLDDLLQTRLGLTAGQVDADYDPSTNRLSFHVEFSQTLPSTTKRLNFPAKLGPLADLTSTGDIVVIPTLLSSFDFGFDLSASSLSLAERFFVDDALVTMQTSISAPQFPANGRFGFLGITASDSSLTSNSMDPVALSVALTDPVSGNLVNLAELYGNLGTLDKVTQRSLDGSVDFTLNNLGAGTFANLGSDPMVDVQIPNVADLSTVVVTPNSDAQAINAYEHVSFADFVSVLQNVNTFIQNTVATQSAVKTFLPLVAARIDDPRLVDWSSAFAKDVEKIIASPVATVQDLDQAIEMAVGIFSSSSEIQVKLDGNVIKVEVLRELTPAPKQMPLNIDLAALGAAGVTIPSGLQGIPNLLATAMPLSVNVASRLDVDFGVDLSNPLMPEGVLYDTTEVTLDARIVGGPSNFTLPVGALALLVQGGRATLDEDGSGNSAAPAEFKVEVIDESGPSADGRYAIDTLSSSLVSALANGQANVILPLYFPDISTPLGGSPPNNELALAVTNLANIGGSTNLTSPDLATTQQNLVVNGNLGVVAEGLDRFLALLQDALDNTLTGQLPLVGDQLKDAAQFIDGMRGGLLAQLNGKTTTNAVRQSLFDALDSLGLLDEQGGNPGTIDVNDVLVPTDSSTESTFQVKLKKSLAEVQLPFDFDIGIPALRMTADPGSNLKVEVGFEYLLRFGVSRTDGFFIDSSSSDELSVGFDVSLDSPNGVTGELAFLQFNVKDDAAMPSSLSGGFVIDVGAPAGGRVKLNEIVSGAVNIGNLLSADLVASAEVNLDLEATFAGNKDFPWVSADFVLDWDFLPATGFTGNSPTIKFDNVQLYVGDFFNQFIGPIVEVVHDVLLDVKPVIDFLNDPIPIVSDLAVLAGHGEVSLVSIAADVFPFLEPVQIAFDIAQPLLDLKLNGTDAAIVLGDFDLGGADVRSLPDLSGITPNSSGAVADLYEKVKAKIKDIAQSLPNAVRTQVDDLINQLDKLLNQGMRFPLYEDPTIAVRLLFGQTVDLVTLNLPELRLQAQLPSTVIPTLPKLGPMEIGVGGRIDATANLSFGFDTGGLQTYLETGSVDDLLFGGFYMNDVDLQGVDIPEFSLKGSFGAFAELSIPVASAGVFGGVGATIDVNLHDPNNDGRVRLTEVIDLFTTNPVCVFDTAGDVRASLDAFIKVGLNTPLGFVTVFEDRLVFAEEILFDLTNSDCRPPANPILAKLEGSDGGTLSLLVGSRASERNVKSAETNEGYLISLDDKGNSVPSDDEIVVTAFGTHQRFAAADVKRVFGSAGTGNDRIVVDDRILVPVELHGGDGNDTLDGGGGNDRLFGQDHDDVLLGGPGLDLLEGGRGADYLQGDDGDDTLRGGDGNDTLIGGKGGDVLDGGADHDTLNGNEGNDQLSGNSGNDRLFGGDGNDFLEGGVGNDSAFGGAGSDTVIGDGGTGTVSGNDLLNGDDGDDLLIGDNWAVNNGVIVPSDGAGNDTLVGGNGADVLYGQGGNDIAAGDNASLDTRGQLVLSAGGAPGNDLLFGNAGDDRLMGQAGNDSIEGGDGSDVILGGAGNDTLIGGSANVMGAAPDGDDRILGEDGDDVIIGDHGKTGSVILIGGSGNDSLFGGAGADLIFGQGGNDRLEGGSGPDILIGGQGRDIISGQDGHDYIEGGSGADSLYGGAGDDNIIGGLGAISRAASTLDGGNDDGLPILGTSLVLGDYIIGDAGDDVILGDNGTIAADRSLVQTDPLGGAGQDFIFGGLGNDVIFGGGLGDFLNGDIPGGISHDVIVGDQGSLSATQIVALHSTVANSGGNDFISGEGGDDTLLGGDGNDAIDGGVGLDILLGDNGVVTLAGGIVQRIATTAGAGGNDTLNGGIGADIAFGGDGDDAIEGGADASADILLGDNGVVVQAGGGADAHDIFSTDPIFGGVDAIKGGPGNDLIIGGSGGRDMSSAASDDGDTLEGQDGDDILIGDNARIHRDSTYRVESVATIFPSDGGDDSLLGGDGNDILLGGAGGDHLVADQGNDIALGDNGMLDYAFDLDRITTTDPGIGADDTIFGGNGDDILLGGAGGDYLEGGMGDDVLLGDHGLLDYARDDSADLDLITTIDPTFGASDTLLAQEGNDIVMGGTDKELIFGGSGRDLIFGDHGKVDFDLPSDRNFFSIDTGSADGGAADEIHGEGDEDIILGGQGGDLLFGEAADDDLIGGHNVPGGADDGDTIDGGSGNDALVGDNGSIIRRLDTVSPLIRSLVGSTLYDTAGAAAVTAAAQINPMGVRGRDILLYDHDASTPVNRYGNDTMAGGADDDVIFGGLGDDSIQGDASVTRIVGPSLPSVNSATDGDDYVEGNGGDDLIFGNLGQDDLIGGSSDLFGLSQASERIDAVDVIFGGAGTDIGRNHAGDTSVGGHAQDADAIIGDNGRLFRIVGTNGTDSGNFLSFNYDNYPGGLRIIPRAADLLDYTPGAGLHADVGAGDFLHGESGDDFIWGATGNDVIFGDGQNDDLVGGAHHDWISGGTGDDGILGDDGKILTSRNGHAEPLYGVTALPASSLNQVISTPGKIQQATINVANALKKGVDLEPFDEGGDDILYGGHGHDALHGGGGDDAISGAEALPSSSPDADPASNYDNPSNPGNVLGFNPVTEEFARYDEFAPLVKLNQFLLNFAAAEDDGKDVLFGDLGNDWLVGGTNQDHLFGGRGADLLNADDNPDTNAGLNDQPDADPTLFNADIAYGGAGRDILIANTGADRLIDWVGEFNSYLVPFAPFGMFTVSRTLQPHLQGYLYNLAKSDGADQTRGGDPIRHGEPNGELGLVIQQDADFQDQTGSPADPQPGNTSGQKRDVMGKTDFDSAATGFASTLGTWTVSGGRYVASGAANADSVSVFFLDESQPKYFEISVLMNADKARNGLGSNGYIVFDYQSDTDFKFAGINVDNGKLEIGQRSATGWNVRAASTAKLASGKDMDVKVIIDGTTAQVQALGVSRSYDFNTPIYTGMVGLATRASRTTFDGWKVQKPTTLNTFAITEDFSAAASWFTPQTGMWQVTGGAYSGSALSGDAVSTRLFDVVANSRLEMNVAISSGSASASGLVFDYYDPSRYKFAVFVPELSQIMIGHVTSQGTFVDAAINHALPSGSEFVLGISLLGSSVTVSVNNSEIGGYKYLSLLNDGALGLRSRNGSASFDNVVVQGNDWTYQN